MKKILCLHGKQQNKTVFRTKLGRIPHKLRHLADLSIIDGPIKLDNTSDENIAEKDERSWFGINERREINISSLQDSIEYIRTIWQAEGPYDGVLGFSMGGTLAALLATDQYIDQFPGLSFLICISAPDFPTTLTEDPSTFNLAINPVIKSLHIAGESDTAVPIEWSQRLLTRFTDPTSYQHSQGHLIPMKAENTQWIASFVESLS